MSARDRAGNGIDRREAAGALAVFAAAALIFTWPTAARLWQPGLIAVSSPFDSLIYLWNFDWLREALGHGVSPLRTARLSAPDEIPLALYTPTYLYALFSLPFQLAVPGETGLYLAFRSCVLGSFTLAGLACYGLGRACGLERGGAFLAGIAFAYCAARMTNLARLNALGSEWLPLALLGLHWSLRETRKRGPVLLAAACTALAYNSATHVATTAIGLLVVAAAGMRAATPGWTARIAAAAGATLLLAAPLAPGLVEALQWPAPQGSERVAFSLDLTSLWWPNLEQLWLGRLVPARPTNYLEQYFSFFPGVVFWALLSYALFRRTPVRERGAWVALMGVGAVLALGPEAKWLERPTGVSLPYAWLEGVLPPLQITRVPARFLVLFSLGAALLVGSAVDDLSRRRPARQGLRVAALALLALLVGLEGSQGLPLAVLGPITPQRVSISAELPVAGSAGGSDRLRSPAVLDLPFDTHHTRRLAMFHQLEHRRPLLFADYPRAPRSNLTHYASSKLFGLLRDPTGDAGVLDMRLAALDLRREARELRRLGIDALVLHHAFFRRVIGRSDPAVALMLERGRVLERRLSEAWAPPRRLDAGSYSVLVFPLAR